MYSAKIHILFLDFLTVLLDLLEILNVFKDYNLAKYMYSVIPSELE